MDKLAELLEEQKRKERIVPPELTPIVVEKSPLQRISDAEMEIKAFQKEQELESVKSGYANFLLREKTIVDQEKGIADRETSLKENIGAFELEQKTRMEKYNSNVSDYNKAYELLKTERKESQRIMEEAIKKKSEADSIIKSQTEQEKISQEKQDAYTENLDSSIKLMTEIYKVLKKQDDAKLLSLAVVIHNDLTLTQWLIFKKCSVQSIVDILSVDIDRITEVCEYLQNTKKDYNQVLKYLLDSTEWLQTSLKIEWQPADK
jgi:hypothetical protein